MLSKINPLNLGIVSELTWSAGSKNRSIVDDISAVSDLQGFSDVVVGDEDPDLLGFKMLNDLLDLKYRDRIDTGKWLIQENELGEITSDRAISTRRRSPPERCPPDSF